MSHMKGGGVNQMMIDTAVASVLSREPELELSTKHVTISGKRRFIQVRRFFIRDVDDLKHQHNVFHAKMTFQVIRQRRIYRMK